MKSVLWSLLAVILLVEEWLWNVLNQFGRTIIQHLHWQRYEKWLLQCQPIQALWIFLVPLVLVMPFNWLAFMLLAHGLIVQGLILELAIKLFTTLVIARIFTLTKLQLLTYPVINWSYVTISDWLHWAHQKLSKTHIYHLAKQLKSEIKGVLQNWKKDKAL